MPANRASVGRDVKAAEIVDAAELLLLRDGYETTTMAAIARQAGVSSNAVYWYFPSKDDLLAAVLSRRQEDALARLSATSDAPFADQVLAGLAELDATAVLTATVHERARYSPAVAGVHERFHAVVGQRLRDGFEAAGLQRHDAQLAAAAIAAIVEGVHLHEPERDAAARDELVRWALARLAAKEAPPLG